MIWMIAPVLASLSLFAAASAPTSPGLTVSGVPPLGVSGEVAGALLDRARTLELRVRAAEGVTVIRVSNWPRGAPAPARLLRTRLDAGLLLRPDGPAASLRFSRANRVELLVFDGWPRGRPLVDEWALAEAGGDVARFTNGRETVNVVVGRAQLLGAWRLTLVELLRAPTALPGIAAEGASPKFDVLLTPRPTSVACGGC